MPKVTAPKQTVTVVTPETDTPAVDISPLVTALTPLLSEAQDAEQKKDGAIIDIAIECRNFRAQNPTLERASVKLAIQTAISESYDLALEHVQTKPEKPTGTPKKEALEKHAKRESAYVLASTLLSIAWPKDEKQDQKVKTEIEKGERRFVVLKKAAAKPQNNPREREDKSINKENFATRFFEFLSRAQSDMSIPMLDVLDLAETHIPEMRKPLTEAPVPQTEQA